jgi:hypothetical protein
MNEYTWTITVTVESEQSELEAVETFAEYGVVYNSRLDPQVTGWVVEQP